LERPSDPFAKQRKEYDVDATFELFPYDTGKNGRGGNVRAALYIPATLREPKKETPGVDEATQTAMCWRFRHHVYIRSFRLNEEMRSIAFIQSTRSKPASKAFRELIGMRAAVAYLRHIEAIRRIRRDDDHSQQTFSHAMTDDELEKMRERIQVFARRSPNVYAPGFQGAFWLPESESTS